MIPVSYPAYINQWSYAPALPLPFLWIKYVLKMSKLIIHFD